MILPVQKTHPQHKPPTDAVTMSAHHSCRPLWLSLGKSSHLSRLMKRSSFGSFAIDENHHYAKRWNSTLSSLSRGYMMRTSKLLPTMLYETYCDVGSNIRISSKVLRRLSTTTTTTETGAKVDSKQKNSNESNTSSDPNSDTTGNIFLDNLGKIFLSAIALIIAMLVRSHYATKGRNALRDRIEATAALDPLEIQELRLANAELTPDVFRTLLREIHHEAGGGSNLTYEQFIFHVRRILVNSIQKGEHVTIEMGHYIDRVVLTALHRRGRSSQDSMPLTFWFTVLSLALNAAVPDRIRILYEILLSQNEKVSIPDTIEMVGYLQDTCQLVPDAQIIPVTSRKYPIQQFCIGSPVELVNWPSSEKGKATMEETVDLDAFAEILRSKSVCAWGECYHKRRKL